MAFAISNSTSGNGVLSNQASGADPDVQQLVGEIARLAMQDPASAAQVVRDVLSAMPDSTNAEVTSGITAGLDDRALAALAQMPAGRELLDLLNHPLSSSPAGTEPRAQTDRIRDALFSVAQGPADWANRVMHQTVLPGLLNATAPGKNSASGAAPDKEKVKSAFKEEFAAKAANKQEFDAFMKQIYGNNYDKNLAEKYRQSALAGDFSWLPDVKFVDAETLRGGNGAYNAQEGVVYINKDVAAADPNKAAQVFVEEAGAHLDAKLNTVDTQGDEGEMFRRVLSGEQLSQKEIDVIRNDDDRSTITVDGKQVEVEFWFGSDFVDAVGDAAKAVGNAVVDGAKAVGGAIVDGAKAVGGAIVDGAKWVGNAISDAASWTGSAVVDAAKWAGDAVVDVGRGVVDGVKKFGKGIYGAVKDVGQGLYEMTAGFVSNLVQGNIGEAFSSVVRGLDKAVFQSTERMFSGVMDSVQSLTNGITDALGPIGEPFRWVSDRVFDIGHTVLDTGFGLARDAFRLIPDTVNGFVSDVERAVKLAADGKWSDAAKQFGMAFVNVPVNLVGHVVDSGARILQAVASAAQTAVGVEPPARGLSDDERKYLEAIYGDSVDYDMIRVKPGGPLNNAMAPHTVGNTVYMPADQFDSNGKLTTKGLETLGHEVGHVWQNQNGGGDYLHNALFAQGWASIFSGTRNGAYDWQSALKDGESFESMNDEEKAKVTEDIGIALKNDGMITTADGYTAEEVAFLNETWNEVKAGEGAG